MMDTFALAHLPKPRYGSDGKISIRMIVLFKNLKKYNV